MDYRNSGLEHQQRIDFKREVDNCLGVLFHRAYTEGMIGALESSLCYTIEKIREEQKARAFVKQMERQGIEDQLKSLKASLFPLFIELKKEALETGRHRVRTQIRRRIDLHDEDKDRAYSFGITVNRRNGETVYYVVNAYPPNDYKPHDIERWIRNSSYCGVKIEPAIDLLARRLLGGMLNQQRGFDDLYKEIEFAMRGR